MTSLMISGNALEEMKDGQFDIQGQGSWLCAGRGHPTMCAFPNEVPKASRLRGSRHLAHLSPLLQNCFDLETVWIVGEVSSCVFYIASQEKRRIIFLGPTSFMFCWAKE